jgi:ATP-dependent protease ClpP protease subunit
MKTQRQRQTLAGLQARAKAGAARHAENRVIVNRSVIPASDEAGGTPEVVSAELWLYGTVGGYWWGFDSDDVAAALRTLGDVDEVLVRLHSFGGNAIEGIAIANLLANHPATVRIVVDGLAASAASMIALAGEELVMSPGSQLMVHDAWMWTAGNAAELRADADWIDKQSQNYAETYAHRAGGTAAEWREQRMLANNGEGTWYSAQEAVDIGLADRVANIASTTPPPPMPEPVDLDEDPDFAAAAEWDFEVLLHPAAQSAWSSWRRYPGAPKPPSASAVGSNNTEGGSAVAFTDEQITTLRTKLGVAGDADEATILAALDEALEERAEPESGNAAVTEGDVVIPQVRLKDLESAAASGVEALKKLHAKERKEFLDEHKAKYPAASRADWEKRYDRDPEGTRELLSSAADLVPTTENGHADAPDAEAGGRSLADIREDETYKNWSM